MTEKPTHPSHSFYPHGERIRFEQIDALYRNVAIGVLGALAAAALIAWTLVEVDNMAAFAAPERRGGGGGGVWRGGRLPRWVPPGLGARQRLNGAKKAGRERQIAGDDRQRHEQTP